jgi:hypothetical protein
MRQIPPDFIHRSFVFDWRICWFDFTDLRAVCLADFVGLDFRLVLRSGLDYLSVQAAE